MPISKRNKRRRSHQCCGARARNYVRTINRVLDSSRTTTEQVVDDARASGAMAAFDVQRQRLGEFE